VYIPKHLFDPVQSNRRQPSCLATSTDIVSCNRYIDYRSSVLQTLAHVAPHSSVAMAGNFTTILPRLSSSATTFPYVLPLPPARTILGFLLPLIPVHLVLVKIFRNRFSRQLQQKHPYSSNPGPGQKPLSEMPLLAAHDVIKLLSAKDFPYFFNLALQFALIRTYAVPSVGRPTITGNHH
jgi:hypothetical protein